MTQEVSIDELWERIGRLQERIRRATRPEKRERLQRQQNGMIDAIKAISMAETENTELPSTDDEAEN